MITEFINNLMDLVNDYINSVELFNTTEEGLVMQSVNVAALIFMFFTSFVIYVLVVGRLLPQIFIRPSKRGVKAIDRGLKKYVYDDGRAIVYEPAAETKRYVDQYIVSSNNGEKFLKCKVDPRVYSLEYDVIAFNSRDRIIDVLAVTDLIVGKRELTSAVSLPMDTAYVSVLAKRVNGIKVSKTPTVYYSGTSLCAYVGLSAAFTAFQVMLLKPYVETLFNAFSKDIEVISDAKTVIASVAISAICSALVILAHCTRDIKIKNDGKIFLLIKKIIGKMRGVRHGKRSTANFKRILSIFAGR